MMDLRVSAVLLFVFLTGGYSFRCYSCDSDLKGFCGNKEVETCPAGFSKCGISTWEKSKGPTKVSFTAKGCLPQCKPGTINDVTLQCCDTDLCNAADGMYKGSFFLLFSPLLFYFLFQ